MIKNIISNSISVISAISIGLLVFLLLPVVAYAGTATITANPSTVYTGGNIDITWSSSDTFLCVGTGFSTGGATSGSVTAFTSTSGVKTYSVTCYDESPSCTLNLKNTTVDDFNPNTCNANISYSPNGSCYPKNALCETSTPKGGGGTYTVKTFRCEGGCSTITASDTVTVNDPPPPADPSVTLSAAPLTVTNGNATLISWNAESATSCSGVGFSTNGATSGSTSVTPTSNTTYSITCDGNTYSSSPGVWEYNLTDFTDLWCPLSTTIVNNTWDSVPQCPTSSLSESCPPNQEGGCSYTNSGDPTGLACTGTEACKINSASFSCVVRTDIYLCNGGSAPNQVSDSVSVTTNGAPNAPTITGPTTGTVGTNYSFGFQASDPDGNTVRYRIDWNPSTGTDEDLPVSGYTTSNTLLSTLRSWATPGVYSFRAKTEDSSTAQSGYATHSITISSAAAQCGDGIDNDGDGDIDLADAGCSSGSDTSESPNPQCSDGIDNDTNGQIDYPADAGCSSSSDDDESTLAQCSDGIDNDTDGNVDLADAGCSSGADNSEGSPPASLIFDVSPGLVRSGDSVSVTWNASNVQSCSLTGTNGDSWSGTSGTQVSSALTSETTFTLSCVDLEDSAVVSIKTVKIVPSFQEI